MRKDKYIDCGNLNGLISETYIYVIMSHCKTFNGVQDHRVSDNIPGVFDLAVMEMAIDAYRYSYENENNWTMPEI